MNDPQQVTNSLSDTNDAMRGIITAANNGEFVITPDAGDELIQIFQEIEDWTGKVLDEMGIIKQRTLLGNSPAGVAIADFNQQVATGDEDSFEEMILRIQDNAPKVVQALREGTRLYQETDEGNATNLGKQA
ncbi:hypothetical protein SAMN04487904_10662 [Actinopolyspora lacussalsi subsp. righensis]|uniref:Excreted virulence factor EspC, type VII ESX diderm n=1 Tax=Actinopolyspora righensis TaxID=995060 RepID=A0A1I7A6D2_9ACTN|nr:hypothetical protein [Actinopolyspora righensis]SFT70489.1 hypothetical protein SAMN04487904_10662 [Actinopolyspora righensis]